MGTLKTLRAIDLSPTVTTLTVAYAAGWESDELDCSGFEDVKLLLTFGGGIDATTVELRTRVTDRDGSVFFTEYDVVAGAPATVRLDEVQITAAQIAADPTLVVPYSARGVRRMVVQAKRTGGAAGTLQISATGG